MEADMVEMTDAERRAYEAGALAMQATAIACIDHEIGRQSAASAAYKAQGDEDTPFYLDGFVQSLEVVAGRVRALEPAPRDRARLHAALVEALRARAAMASLHREPAGDLAMHVVAGFPGDDAARRFMDALLALPVVEDAG